MELTEKYKLICGYPQNDKITQDVRNLEALNAELVEALDALIDCQPEISRVAFFTRYDTACQLGRTALAKARTQ